jgi:class 3 adenylate cyclase
LVPESSTQLGERLVNAGVLSPKALEEALAQQKTGGGYLSDVLVDGGFIEEGALLEQLATGAEVITAAQLSKARPAEGLLESLGVAAAERLNIMPLVYDSKTRTLTVAVPDTSEEFLKEVAEATGAPKLKPLLALRHGIGSCIQRCYYNDQYAFAWLQRRPATTQKIAQAAEAFMARLTPAPIRPRPKTLPPIVMTAEEALAPVPPLAVAPVAPDAAAPVPESEPPPLDAAPAAEATPPEPAAPLEPPPPTPLSTRAAKRVGLAETAPGLYLPAAPPPPAPAPPPAAVPSEPEAPATGTPLSRKTPTLPRASIDWFSDLPPESDAPPAEPEAPPDAAPVPLVTPPTGPAPGMLLKLHEELESARREIHILRVANELSLHLARERNVFELLERVLAFAFDNISADEGVLLLRDAASGELKPCAVRTRSDDQREIVASQTLLKQIVQTGQAVLATDAAYDPVFSASKTVATHRARSLMGVPLVIGDKIEGAITLTTYGVAGAFSPQDVNVLSGIAAQTGIALENLTLSRRLAADSQSRDRLSRFLSPALVEAATHGELEVVESGQLQEATILFADIRGFTTIAERLDPKSVVQLLNHHFELLLDVVFAHEGILDKFIGDGLMALWGVPVKRHDDATRAMRAALEMRDRVRQLKDVVPGRMPYEIGIGLHTGPVVFGAIGAARRLELTAVGDAVNVASRLCGVAAPGEIILSDASRRAAGEGFSFLPLPPVQLRGRAQPLYVFKAT